MAGPVRVTVWNEFVHERENPVVAALYPHGIHRAIGDGIAPLGSFEIRYATLEEPEHGLQNDVLEQTDVLVWWGHKAHDDVADEVVDRVHQQVLSGMGIVVLHSGHYSKIFKRLMGTNCSLKWRDVGEKERLWNVAPDHEIMDGIGPYFEIAREEMYGERFDIPEPDELLMISWFEGGEVFRSGCTWRRGHGRVFYFRPGHETFPTYRDLNVLRIIAHGCTWARRRIRLPTNESPNTPELEFFRKKKGDVS